VNKPSVRQQQRSKVLPRMRSWTGYQRSLLRIAGMACRLDRYEERCRRPTLVLRFFWVVAPVATTAKRGPVALSPLLTPTRSSLKASSFVSSLNLAEKSSKWRYTTGDARVALSSTSTLHSTNDEDLGEQQARGVAEHHRPEEDGVAALGDGAVQHSTSEGGDEHERCAQHCQIE
jgi:hypothetical protein